MRIVSKVIPANAGISQLLRAIRMIPAFAGMTVALPTFAATLIIEPDMGRQPILDKINQANQSVQLVMYNLTDKSLLNALVEQRKSGRNVQVILEQSPYKTTDINKKAIRKLKSVDIDWHGKVRDARFIHQKTLLLDKKEALVMTFNFTQSAFKKQRNFAIDITDPAEVAEIDQHFKADWQSLPVSTESPNLIWSPDDSRGKLLSLINGAKKELYIYAQTITDKSMIKALQNTAARGVKVIVVTSSKLQISGVTVVKSLHYYIHAKAMIIDNQTAILGSINLTRTSLNENRELAVITHDQNIIKQLLATFSYDMGKLL